MNQVLKWLSGGDLRSDGVSNEVVESVPNGWIMSQYVLNYIR